MISVSVGMIVFNGLSALPDNMLQSCIYQMYDLAKEIVIVEGATKADGKTHLFDGHTTGFTRNGLSTDGTREFLKSLKDPQNKIKVIMKQNGFWNGKTEMCNEYLKHITADYVWHIDADEFYHEKDIPRILELLEIRNPFAMNFYAYHFYGNFNNYIGKEFGKNWGNNVPWRRIYKNNPNYSKWISHEPPNFLFQDGVICDQQENVIDREQMESEGIRLYHYSQVQKKQAIFKNEFYNNPVYITNWDNWQRDNSYTVFESNTKQFQGSHPEIIKKLM